MKAFRIVLSVLGAVTLFLGLVFLIGGRPATGAVILVTGGLLMVPGLRNPPRRDVIVKHELELTGDMSLENLKCRQCGASLSPDNTSLRAGTVFVSCPYCHSDYQMEEAPKW